MKSIKSYIDELKSIILSDKTILIITHKSPDGDAIGSAFALGNLLFNINQKVNIMVPDEIPVFLEWIIDESSVPFHIFNQNIESCKTIIQKAEIIFCLDFNAVGRVGLITPFLIKSKGIKIMIDHHQNPENFPQYILSDISVSSTSELIYDFIQMLDLNQYFDKKIANAIYTGILTDTGSFRYSTCTSKTHKIVSILIEKGVQNNIIYDKIYDGNRIKKIKLLGYVLNYRLNVIEDFQTAYITLNNEELKKFDVQQGDTEGLIYYALSIKNIKFAAFFREHPIEKIIRISFRSKEGFNVNEFAQKYFNGGGHILAAGGKSDKTLDETIIYFKSLLLLYKKQLQNFKS